VSTPKSFLIPIIDGHIDCRRRLIVRGDHTQPLTEQEWLILQQLIEAEGRFVSTEDLYRHAWATRPSPHSRAATFAMLRLRKKIEQDPAHPTHLQTVRGRGFRWVHSQQTPPDTPTPAPPERHTFVGRASALSKLKTALHNGAQLISLLGPPGLGKTRLAREIPRVWPHRFGQIWFCDLSHCTDGSTVTTLINQALGLNQISPPSPAHLRALNQTHPTAMLVLDNCDAVLNELTDWLKTALPHLGTLVVLVTSRERLHLAAEVAIVLPPLTASESTALLRQRGVKQPQQYAAEIAQCDGLPLALELTAAALHATSSSPHRPHKNPLQRAISDSWERLTPREQAALASTAAFSGDFDWSAAESVLPPSDIDPLDTLESLVDKSLLQVRETPSGPQFSLLQNIRHFAAHKLASLDPTQRAQARFIAHFQSVDPKNRTTPLDFNHTVKALQLLSEADPSAAITLLLKLHIVFRRAGRGSQLWQLTETLCQHQKTVAGELASQLLNQQAYHLFCQGRYADSESTLRTSLTLVPTDSFEEAKTLSSLGNILHARLQHDEAKVRHQQALVHFEDHKNLHWTTLTLGNLTLICFETEDYKQARLWHNQLKPLYYKFSGVHQHQYNLLDGYIHLGKGDPTEAVAAFMKALTISQDSPHLERQRQSHVALGSALLLTHQPRLAWEHLQLAWSLMAPEEEVQTSGLIALRLAQCARRRDDPKQAAHWTEVAVRWEGAIDAEHHTWSLRLLQKQTAEAGVDDILNDPVFQSVAARQIEVRITVMLLNPQ
jgi:predicted ATPase